MIIISAEVNSVSPVVINTALIFLSALVTFLTALYFVQRKENRAEAVALTEERDKVKIRLHELEGKLALVAASVVPISTVFQAILIKELTHFHTPEMDALMVKVGPPNTMTPEEQDRLTVLLRERTVDMGPEISDSERDAAMILPAVMKRARHEQELLLTEDHPKVKLVAVIEPDAR